MLQKLRGRTRRKADTPEASAMVSDAEPSRSLSELSSEMGESPLHSLKNHKKFSKHDTLYGEWIEGGSTICAARYVRCVGNSEEKLNFLFRGVYKVWRAGYHSVCRLVRNQIGTIKDPGALLLLSLSPPITPKVRSGIFSFLSVSAYQPVSISVKIICGESLL